MSTQKDFQTIAEYLYEGAYIFDSRRRITYWNKAAEKITGFTSAEVIGRSCSDNILMHIDADGNNLCVSGCPLAATMNDGEVREADVYLHHKAGHRVPVRVRAIPLRDDDGHLVGAIELFTESMSKEENLRQIKELQELILLDALTQLPNRRYLEAEIEAAFSQLRRNDVSFGVLFFDIDHFKQFNDSYGHLVGDQALKTTAQTLAGAIRPQDHIGRWGGEEFVGVFPGVHADKLEEIANRLRILVGQSEVAGEGASLSLTISVGGVIADRTDTLMSIVQKADAMMYESKRNGRNCVTVGKDAHQKR